MKKHNLFKGLLTCLLALVLVAGTFAASAKADEASKVTATYDPATETIKLSGATTYYYAVIKEDGTELPGKKFQKTTAAELKLDKTGLKVAENKELKLVVLAEKPADDKTAYNATITVAATPYKKMAVNVNYAAAADACAISSVVLTPAEKGAEAITVTGAEADANKALWARLQYSDDAGKTWKAVTELTGEALAKLTDPKGKGAKLSFKLLGDGTATKEVRGTKVVAVSIKVQKTLKSVKVDYVKGTIAIKNGMDYVVVATPAENGDVAPTEGWITVLPYNKKGEAKTKDSKDQEIDQTEVAATEYVAVKFSNKEDNNTAKSFTAVKIAAMDLETLLGTNASVDIWVRTSAGVGKAQSTPVKVTVKAKADAPEIAATDGVYASSNEKGEIVVPALTAKETGVTTFEYIIIDGDTVDLAASKWTKLAKGAKINVNKASSKVVRVDGEKATIAITDKDVKILVRSTAVKGKVLSSKVTETMLKYVAEVPEKPDNPETEEDESAPAIPEHYDWVPVAKTE